VPKHFADVPAIGPGGAFTGNIYEDYIEEAQRFAQALFRVYKEGDAYGRPFFFPKPQVHITERLFQTSQSLRST
jgi:ribonucleoside-triphosphate reductase